MASAIPIDERDRTWAYRADIDGLRAIAVLAVLLSHLGVERMAGGYVGVDVFFVISGYIVTGGLLLRADGGADHSATAFYLRRLRRLMPNLLAMVLAVLATASWLFLPEDLARLPGRIAAAVLGFSNWLFAWQSGYFLPASKWNPLLHTWTLSVEFQFYLVAPLVVVAMARSSRVALQIAIPSMTLASFAWALATRASDNAWHFYDSVARAWEFLLGATVLLWRHPRLPRWLAEALCLAALMILAASFMVIDRDGSFPDLRALAPALATAVLIALLPVAPAVSRMLTVRPVNVVGKASYSIYLWHWPTIVFVMYLCPGIEANRWFALAAIPPILAVSFLAWRWFEQPFRSREQMTDQRFTAVLAAAVAVIGAGSLALVASSGLPGRFDQRQRAVLRDAAAFSPRREACHRGDLQLPLEASCRFGAAVAPTIAIWSDSHGVELVERLAPALAARGQSAELLSFSSCPPRAPARTDTDCASFQRSSLEHLLAKSTIATVIVAGALDGAARPHDPRWGREFTAAAEALLAAGKRIVIIYPIPEQPFHVPRALVNRARFGIDFAAQQTARTDYLARTRAVFAVYDRLGGARVARVRPDAILCPRQRCIAERAGRPLYFDDNHLTLLGADPIARVVAVRLDAASAAPSDSTQPPD